MKVPQYIFIYVYMQWMSGMRKVREGIGKVKVKLKGTSRPQDKNPIGEYISNRSNRDFFYWNFLCDFLRGFSTPIFYEDFLGGFSTATFPSELQSGFLVRISYSNLSGLNKW